MSHSSKDLRQDGWMTIDEFIEALVPGLTTYLKGNWGHKAAEELHHPVDLSTTASIYIDIACHIFEDFTGCIHDRKKL